MHMLSSVPNNLSLGLDPVSEIVRQRLVESYIIDQVREIQRRLSEHFKMKELPAVIIDNLGTGFGKTVGTLLSYVEHVSTYDDRNRHLVFTTPQKAQIAIPPFVIDQIRKAGITIVCFLQEKISATPTLSVGQPLKMKPPPIGSDIKFGAGRVKIFHSDSGLMSSLI
ncbi:hypothetical protein [Endozoicomonas acroporae]|uniref:hypothetical protein n=1 Tax=Endozoicomonas acroporae TaxID=1701104 RepID=UPI003D7B81FC